VLVVAVIALRNPKHTTTQAGSDTRTSTPSVSSTPASSSLRPSPSVSTKSSHRPSPTHTTTSAIGSLPLVVLNDTTTPNLARDAASRFEGGGWNVTTYDENYTNDIVSTVAYYDPDVAGAKKAATALQKQYPTIKRVVAKFPELPAGPIVVVLTSDYSPS
jgi:LytR cell envelope-related transcriptional attenuator